MLQQWKLEKQKRIEEIKKKQKPVFRVGIIQRKATGSPLINLTNTFTKKNLLDQEKIIKVSKPVATEKQGVVTRSKAKLLKPLTTPPRPAASKFLKIDKNKPKAIKKHNFVVPKAVSQLPYSQRITIPSSPQITKSSRKGKKPIEPEPEPEPEPVPESSVVKTPINFNFSVQIGKNVNVSGQQNKTVQKKAKEMDVTSSNEIVPEDSNNEIKQLETQLKNIMKNDEVSSSSESKDYVPIHYSPFVNKVRGSAKKSPRNSKIRLTMDVNEQIEKEENEFNCRIFSFRWVEL